MARAARREIGMPEEAREVPKKKSPETRPVLKLNLEAEQLSLGELVDLFGADGETHEAVVAGEVDGVQVFSLENGLRIATNEKEQDAREAASLTYETIDESFDRALDAVIQIKGIQPEEAQELRRLLADKRAEILMKAVIESSPDAAVVHAVQSLIEADLGAQGVIQKTKVKRSKAAQEALLADIEIKRQEREMSLNAAQQELMESRTAADAAERAEDENAYKDAMKRVYAAELLVVDLRQRFHRGASSTEKSQIALETQGAVKPEPDDLYDEGLESVKKRIDTLQNQMRAADKAKDEVTWTIANDELNRHRTMLPVIERAAQLEQIDELVETTMKSLDEQNKEEVKNQRVKIKEKVRYWDNISVTSEEALARLQSRIEEVKGGRAFWEARGMVLDDSYDEEEGMLDNKLKQATETFRAAEREIMDLIGANKELVIRNADVLLDKEGLKLLDAKLGAESTLLRQMHDLYRSEPERTLKVVAKLMKGKTLRDTTRTTLEKFLNDPEGNVTEDSIDIEQRVNDTFTEYTEPESESTNTEDQFTPPADPSRFDNFEALLEDNATDKADSDDFEIDIEEPQQADHSPSWEVPQSDFENFLHSVEYDKKLWCKAPGDRVAKLWILKHIDTQTARIRLERKSGTEYVQIEIPVTPDFLKLNERNLVPKPRVLTPRAEFTEPSPEPSTNDIEDEFFGEGEKGDALYAPAPSDQARARLASKPRGNRAGEATQITRLSDIEPPAQAPEPEAPKVPKKSFWKWITGG